jgi:nucleotide-binding universal stress UspA family protein
MDRRDRPPPYAWRPGSGWKTEAEVLAVHVIEPPEYDIRSLGPPHTILNEANWHETSRTELEGTWCRPLVEAGVRHRVQVEEGRAGPCLAAIAKRENADLIVAGRRGLKGLAEMVQGSVTYYLTHHAPCPVAVMPPEPRAT